MAKKRNKKRPAPIPSSCPCGGGDYASCCQPLHQGDASAKSAEQLMRARFSAFVAQQGDYLWRTLHPDHDDVEQGRDTLLQTLASSFAAVRYQGLRILDRDEPDGDGAARVLFLVRCERNRRDTSFVEESTFMPHEGHWRYLTGRSEPAAGLSHDPASMHIGHWSCGHDHDHDHHHH